MLRVRCPMARPQTRSRRLALGVLAASLVAPLIPAKTERRPTPPVSAGWDQTAARYRGQHGKVARVDCPAGGPLGTVYGTDVYTDDSSVCSAAVHTGDITVQSGGRVDIAILPGEKRYRASRRNGVTTRAYGAWGGSFEVLGATPLPPPRKVPKGVTRVGWALQGAGLAGKVGQRHRLFCAGQGTPHSVWGTGLYTADSSVCTAAVHAGVIQLGQGGPIEVELRPGARRYVGSRHHGILTSAWKSYPRSFVIVGGQLTPPPQPPPGQFSWTDTATHLRGQVGSRVTVTCPANGSLQAAVWGDGTYTDDSAVCVAAVHDGRLSARNGGRATLEVLPGLKAYAGSRRHGVTTGSYGRWHGSYRFVP